MIRSGTTEVILAGVVTSFNADPIEFSIPIDKTNLLITVIAKVDTDCKEFSTRFCPLSDTQANIIFLNPHLLNPARTATPANLGTIFGRKLYYNFNLETFFSDGIINSFVLHYSFYLEDKQPEIISEQRGIK